MARKKRSKKKEKRKLSQDVLMLLTGGALTLCILSIGYGFLIRQSVAEHEVQEFRIEVLNGTGEKGLAARAAAALRQKGIDVFQVENADHFSYRETILIGRKRGEDLQTLGQALGCDNVIEQLTADSFVDATLILGADYRSLNLEMDDS